MTRCPCDGRACSLTADDPRHATRNGYSNRGCRCTPCRAASATSARERYAADPIRRAQRRVDNANYRAQHADALNARNRAYYADTREQRLAHAAAYHAANRDAINARKRARRAEARATPETP